jgi:hypothetical protein
MVMLANFGVQGSSASMFRLEEAQLDCDVLIEASVTQGTLASQMWCIHSGVLLVWYYRDVTLRLPAFAIC